VSENSSRKATTTSQCSFRVAHQRAELPKVRYAGVYPGVRSGLLRQSKQLEYDFVVSPGADPNAIGLAFGGGPDGSKKIPLSVNHDGDLVATLNGGTVSFHKPIVYQNQDSTKTPVEGRYLLKADGHVGFELGAYDHTKQLIIDPYSVIHLPRRQQ